MESKSALVTGAAGFIGSRVCEELARKGWKVLGIDNINDYYDVRLKYGRLRRMGFDSEGEIEMNAAPLKSETFENLSFVRADITDREAMESIFREMRPEVVMNLAAQAGVRYSIINPFSYAKNNIEGFLVLLECARHYPVKRFVYASSSSVYGGNENIPFREDDTVDNPVSLYAATKKSNEIMARAYHNLYDIPAIGLRFFTVYGPWGRPDMAPMLFAKAISEESPINVFNGGEMKRDFTYIDDIVDGVVKVMESDTEINVDNDILNIGHSDPVELMEFISLLEEALGKKAVRNYLPMQKGDVKLTFADTSRLRDIYGYRPSTSLRDGIASFARWYMSAENPLR